MVAKKHERWSSSGHTVTRVRGPPACIVRRLGARATGPHCTASGCAGHRPALYGAWVRGPPARIVQCLGARATGPHCTASGCAGHRSALYGVWVRGPPARIVRYLGGCAFGMTTLYTDEPVGNSGFLIRIWVDDFVDSFLCYNCDYNKMND